MRSPTRRSVPLAHIGQEIFPRDQQTPEVLAVLQKPDADSSSQRIEI
jgi:hypothetical protein